jgi:hypothetical protein
MRIEVLSENYCAFGIQNNRCCLTAQMHKANFLMHFEEHLTKYQKSGVNSFSQQNKSIYNFIKLSRRNNTVDPVYSEQNPVQQKTFTITGYSL